MKLFDFDPSEVNIKIHLAMSYAPRILSANISVRKYNGFLYVVVGRYHYTFCGGSCSAGAGDMVYLPANSIPYHYEVSDEKSEGLQAIQVEFELIDTKSRERMSFAQNPVLVDITESKTLQNAMKSVVSAYTSTNLSSKFIGISELLFIISLCTQNQDKDPVAAAKRAIAPAVGFIEEHYAEKVKGEDLALLCKMSQSQLRREFNAAYGMPPMAYKRSVVLKLAKNLLRTGEFTISEISEALGFHDIYEFSHFFSKESGVSPREYYKKYNK